MGCHTHEPPEAAVHNNHTVVVAVVDTNNHHSSLEAVVVVGHTVKVEVGHTSLDDAIRAASFRVVIWIVLNRQCLVVRLLVVNTIRRRESDMELLLHHPE